ncbi:MAG: DUF58 domain-containing protein [Clostridium sp.]|jgi:uncharacterized protein (DUF58 family)|nr:DUF58 domain-containing protein [Clostridium sp.]
MIKIFGLGLAAFFLFLVQKWVYRRLWNRNLSVTLEFAASALFEGEKGELLEIIENRKRLPLPVLKVKFQTDRNLSFADTKGAKVTDQFYRNDVFQIGGGEKITRILSFTATRRGYYKINGIDLVAADLFLTTEMLESRGTDQYLYVYPRPYGGREFFLSLQQLNAEVLTRRYFPEDPFEYRGIREYQPYDDIRNVNWKATAKTEEWKVNLKNCTSLQTVRIFFNIEDRGILKKAQSVEASFRVVCGLAEFFLSEGIQVSCYGNGTDILNGEPVELAPSAGTGQMECIYKALARVDTERPAVSFAAYFGRRLMEGRQERNGFQAAMTAKQPWQEHGRSAHILSAGYEPMTFFVAPNGYEEFADLLRKYREAGGEFRWFCPVCGAQEPDLPPDLAQFVHMVREA